jgi:hypothetical protein
MTYKSGRKHVHEAVLAPLIDKLKAIGRNIAEYYSYIS